MSDAIEMPVMSDSATFRRRILFFYGLVTVLAGLTVFTLNPVALQTAKFDIDLLLKVVGPLVAISVFLERALEVFVTALRGGDIARLNRAVASAPEEQVEILLLQRVEYRHRSQRIAFATAIFFGALISTLGVRALEPLLFATTLDSLSGWQGGWFRFVDVVVTATLLGGGSDGIHKVVKLLTDYLDQASQNIRK